MAPKDKTLRIVLADDDAVDRELFREVVRETGFPHTMQEVENGEALLAHLGSTAEKPDIIILDFNMPIKDGRAALKDLKTNDEYKRIPVFVLSTSKAHFDVTLAYDLGANLFLVKPHSYVGMVEMITLLLKLIVTHTPGRV